MTVAKALAWLKERDLADAILGGLVGFLTAGAMFSLIQLQVNEAMNTRAIENAQLQVADALADANRFRASLECTAHTINGCKRWEPMARP